MPKPINVFSKKISIIIVTYNSEHHIYDCLDTIIRNNDIGDNLEIIIVDNNSRNVDLMFDKISTIYGATVQLIKNFKNEGYGQGNNVGIKNSTGDIILIMNPDVRLMHPIFHKALSYFQNEKLAILGMTQMFSEHREAPSFFMTSIYDSPLTSIIERCCSRLHWFIPHKMCFSGACFFINKSKFETIGLFDEKIFMYGEEIDIALRIKREWTQIYDKNMKYLHLAGDRKWSFHTMKSIYISRYYLCRKYRLSTISLLNNAKLWHAIRTFLGKNEYKQVSEEWKAFLYNSRILFNPTTTSNE